MVKYTLSIFSDIKDVFRHVPFALGVVSDRPRRLYPRKKSEQQGGKWWTVDGGSNKSSICLLPRCLWKFYRCRFPPSRDTCCLKVDSSSSFRGMNSTNWGRRRARLQIHLLLPRGAELCSVFLNLHIHNSEPCLILLEHYTRQKGRVLLETYPHCEHEMLTPCRLERSLCKVCSLLHHTEHRPASALNASHSLSFHRGKKKQ